MHLLCGLVIKIPPHYYLQKYYKEIDSSRNSFGRGVEVISRKENRKQIFFSRSPCSELPAKRMMRYQKAKLAAGEVTTREKMMTRPRLVKFQIWDPQKCQGFAAIHI